MRRSFLLAAVLGLAWTASLAARRVHVDGMILQVDPARATMTVSHRDIAGYMPAMVMSFTAGRPAELAPLHPGSLVAFDLDIKPEGALARNIRLRGQQPEFTLPATAVKKPGEVIPEFRLTDQTGRPVASPGLRGKVLALNFIYTRCPLPEVCPRLAANFARLQRRFADDLGTRLLLLSVTLDPQYDTPAVLAAYAQRWKARYPGWLFLTGEPSAVRALAEPLGLLYWPEDGTLAHSSRTAVIDRSGRLFAVVDGPNYAVSQLGDLVALALKESL